MMRLFSDIYKEQEEKFFKQLSRDIDNSMNYITHSAFELFNSESDVEFFQYKNFDNILECRIRDYLVNGVIAEYLKGKIEVTDTARFIHFSNRSIETIIMYEFVIHDKNTIAFRYTDIDDNKELRRELKKSHIDHIEIIHFSNSELIMPRRDGTVRDISFKCFFEKYIKSFSYDSYVNAVKNTLRIAKYQIGYHTMPRLSYRYLSDFRENLTLELSNINLYKNLVYTPLDRFNPKALEVARTLKSMKCRKEMICDFINNKMYMSLIGMSDFAKSFITAEYLYRNLQDSDYFDYTTIACGYLKAVEQLIYEIIELQLKYNRACNCIIKRNTRNGYDGKIIKHPKTKQLMVPFNVKYEDYFDTSLGPMIWFLHDSGCELLKRDVDIELIKNCLILFKNECRNEHFHKDNIYNKKTVTKIRNNTIFILMILLESFKLSEEGNEKDLVLLNAVNNSFERLYKEVRHIPYSNFVIELDCDCMIHLTRLISQDNYRYDENGVLISSIHFVINENNIKMTDFESENEFLQSFKEDDYYDLSYNTKFKMLYYVDKNGILNPVVW